MASDVAGDPSLTHSSVAGDEPALPVRRARAPREPRRDGPLQLFLLVVSNHGLWACFEKNTWPLDWPRVALAGHVLLVGVVLATAWQLVDTESQTSDSNHKHMRAKVTSRTKASQLLGFVEYPVLEVLRLAQPVLFANRDMVLNGFNRVFDQLGSCTKPGQSEPALQEHVGSVLDRWHVMRAQAAVLVNMGAAMADQVLRGASGCLHCVAISRRVARKRLLVASQPSRTVVRAFVAAAPALLAISVPQAGSLRGQSWTQPMIDPHLVLDWLQATSFLKDIRKGQLAAHSFARVFAFSNYCKATLTPALTKFEPQKSGSNHFKLVQSGSNLV